MKQKSYYCIKDSERETAKWRVDINIDGIEFTMHLNSDQTINRPFNMKGPVCTQKFSRVMKKITEELSSK